MRSSAVPLPARKGAAPARVPPRPASHEPDAFEALHRAAGNSAVAGMIGHCAGHAGGGAGHHRGLVGALGPQGGNSALQRVLAVQRDGAFVREGQIVTDATSEERQRARTTRFPGRGLVLGTGAPPTQAGPREDVRAAARAVKGRIVASLERIEPEIASLSRGAPQLQDIREAHRRLAEDFIADPAQLLMGGYEQRQLTWVDGLLRAARIWFVEDRIRWAKAIEEGVAKTKGIPHRKERLEDVQAGIGCLEDLRGRAATLDNNKLRDLVQTCAIPLVGLDVPDTSGGAKPLTELPKMTRAAATQAGAVFGRVHPKAVKEAKKEPSDRGYDTIERIIRGDVTNARTGYTPGYRHWHILGEAKSNVVFTTDGRVLGFVFAHIEKDTPAATQAAQCESRSKDPLAEVAVVGGGLFEVVS